MFCVESSRPEMSVYVHKTVTGWWNPNIYNQSSDFSIPWLLQWQRLPPTAVQQRDDDVSILHMCICVYRKSIWFSFNSIWCCCCCFHLFFFFLFSHHLYSMHNNLILPLPIKNTPYRFRGLSFCVRARECARSKFNDINHFIKYLTDQFT